jgi:signal transduction histidine kinase
MPPGDYSFNIRASNNDGFWTTEGVYFAVTVSPPYWQTWWFFLIAGVFCTALLFFGYHNRVKNIRKYNQRLQKKVEERTSELKMSNQELKKLIEEKNKLMSVLAHDLRNPFTAIMGYIELLKLNFEENNDHENLEMTSMLLDSGRNTLNLLENLLQWSGAKEGGLEPDFKLIEINELIREGIAMTEAQSIYKQIKVINKNKKPYWVRADRNMILSVIRNLISNGIKFSGENSVVEIDVKEMDTEIAISVKDRGVGIQHNDLRLLFSSNGARQKLGTQGEKGIGLGLQMCKEFVQKHNCKIWAESKPGQGSTFYFTLQKGIGRAEEAERPERNEKARTG